MPVDGYMSYLGNERSETNRTLGWVHDPFEGCIVEALYHTYLFIVGPLNYTITL